MLPFSVTFNNGNEILEAIKKQCENEKGFIVWFEGKEK